MFTDFSQTMRKKCDACYSIHATFSPWRFVFLFYFSLLSLSSFTLTKRNFRLTLRIKCWKAQKTHGSPRLQKIILINENDKRLCADRVFTNDSFSKTHFMAQFVCSHLYSCTKKRSDNIKLKQPKKNPDYDNKLTSVKVFVCQVYSKKKSDQ